MNREQEEIKDLNDLFGILSGFWKSVYFHHHIRLWYRGQSDEGWELTPGVYRPSFNVKTEAQRLEKEQQMLQDFRVQSASLFFGNSSNEELYFLQQHYKMPTRLLDWSYTPLTALFFAVSENPGKDGALYMMDAYELAVSQKAFDDDESGFKGTPTSSFPRFTEGVQAISHWKGINFLPKYILPVRPYYTDKRIVLQKSCFTFHVPGKETLLKAHNNTLKKYIIPQDRKDKIRENLALLGVNEFTTYGDMESLARTLIAYHR